MIAVVDYRAGNLKSVERALERLGFHCRITGDPGELLAADRIVFPGVGAAGAAMEDLRRSGVDRVLREAFCRGVPFLGICLGAQIILERSEEDECICLGLLPGEVRRFPSPLQGEGGRRLKIPHMGWNGLELTTGHPVLEGIRTTDEFYFVHSYYPAPCHRDRVIGVTEYGIRFPSVIGRDNLLAVQFHPEKSGGPGLRILERFCRWDGRYA
ncbi:MAG: imidazole glycerol phosphate synthase subunit HisH [Desulfobacteraceae bacterium]